MPCDRAVPFIVFFSEVAITNHAQYVAVGVPLLPFVCLFCLIDFEELGVYLFVCLLGGVCLLGLGCLFVCTWGVGVFVWGVGCLFVCLLCSVLTERKRGYEDYLDRQPLIPYPKPSLK